MCQTERNIAGRRVVTRGAKKWKSRVNATMPLVRVLFGNLRLATPPPRSTERNAIHRVTMMQRPDEGEFIVKLLKQSLSFLLSYCLSLTSAPGAFAQADQSAAQSTVQTAQQTPVQAAQQTPEQLQQLVAPIALYPDALVAQILAAATYPDQIVEADRWVQQHTELKGQQLGQEVDKQPWDPSVKALVEFPSVLANMDKNLSWTSSLGDAYVNQQQEVMNAVQAMRDRAQKAGNLKSTPQENVTEQGQTIVIAPADPQVVYVPEFDPWLVYGEPIGIWPGWYGYPGLYLAGPGIAFGLGFGIGYFGGFGWGWHHWGSDWHHHDVRFDNHHYESHSRIFANRNNFNHAGGFHGGGPGARGFTAPQHGFAAQHGQPGTHSGAFSG